ncbi:hypothetical protein [Marinobacter sp.]|uniref:hypothetical protein n=1 Tax=Marinobacter sp. TaxID=50741 RepID=UPI0034A371D0
MGYEQWPNKPLSPQSIELDSDNPRLPGLSHNASQADVFKEIFEAGKAREMVRSIAKAGYFPDQRVVVIRKEGSKSKFIVVEGNRRVCSCRVLLKPKLAPEKDQRFVQKWASLAEPVLDSFRKIPAVIAPSREAAMQLIVSRHLNQAPVRGWSRFAQGKFAINAMDAGEDLEFVEQETGLKVADLRKAIQEARLFDLFLGLDWGDDEREKLLENVDSFPIEALSRVLKSPATKERFGDIEFDVKGWPQFSWDASKTKLFLKRLVYDSVPYFGTGSEQKAELNSRTTNSKTEIGDYLDKLPSEVKPERSSKSTSGSELVTQETVHPPKQTPSQPKKPTKRPPQKRQGPALDADIDCNLNNDKASALLDELQGIYPERLPNGTALLLRSLLEVALIARMKKVGKWGELMAKHAPAGSKGYIPGLEKIITFAASSEKTIPDDNLRRGVQDHRTVPKTFLNMAAHNDQHVLVPRDVRDIITRLQPLLRFLLQG